MLKTPLVELVEIAGPALAHDSSPPLRPDLQHFEQIAALYGLKNGFHAFESALHVFPLGPSDATHDLATWNAQDLWRFAYTDLPSDVLFFAEDLFGYQFCVGDAGISLFNPENAGFTVVASTLDDWARLILEDPDKWAGYSYAREWQGLHGPLAGGRRLMCKLPLMLGGDLSMENLGEVDAVEGMRARGYFWSQIRDLPDGRVEINLVD